MVTRCRWHKEPPMILLNQVVAGTARVTSYWSMPRLYREKASIMYSQTPSNTPVGTATPRRQQNYKPNATPHLYFKRLDRFSHDDRNPLPGRCRMSCVHRHRSNLRRPSQIRDLVLYRVRHYGVRDHAPLPVGRPRRAQPGARIAWRGCRGRRMRRDVPDK